MRTVGDGASPLDEDPYRGPTVPPPEPSGLASVLERNIRALEERRRREEAEAGRGARLAELITRFTGSMLFVYLHLVVVTVWIAINLGLVPGVAKFDPTFVIMATWASVEAIFLSTFVLISQNRSAAVAARRADLDLQISLLSEHEVTRLLQLVSAIADKLDVAEAQDPELRELERDVAPEAVLDELADEETNGRARRRG
jgi:uncharacterized membrane protein